MFVSETITENRKTLLITFDDGETLSIDGDDSKYDSIREASMSNEVKKLEEIVAPLRAIKYYSLDLDGISVANGQVHFEGVLLEGALVQHIIDCIRGGKDCKPFVKFLRKLLGNANENVRKDIWTFITSNKLPITEDGDFCGYKYVGSDRFSIKSGIEVVRIESKENPELFAEVMGRIPYFTGTVVSMDRCDVNPDPKKGCSRGLHIGAYGYSFGSHENRVMLVTADPTDIVAVPNEDSRKVRVSKMTIVGELDLEDRFDGGMFDVLWENYINDTLDIDDSETGLFWEQKEGVGNPTLPDEEGEIGELMSQMDEEKDAIEKTFGDKVFKPKSILDIKTKEVILDPFVEFLNKVYGEEKVKKICKGIVSLKNELLGVFKI